MTENCSVSELLRKALVVAKKLRVSDFGVWVDHELNGYPPGAELPEYRKLVGVVKAWNPYQGWIPTVFADARLAALCSTRPNGQSIGSLETLVAQNKGSELIMPFPPEIEGRLISIMNVPVLPTLHIGSNQIEGILQAVRNTILSWTLDLEDKGIVGEDMSFTPEEQQAAKGLQTVNIENFQGILGNVQHSTVTQNLNMEVQKGDFDSLSAYLQSLGVESPDIVSLEKRIHEDSPPQTRDKLGPGVSSWIGEMVRKAASGTWSIALGTAGSLLAQAIWLYYGLP